MKSQTSLPGFIATTALLPTSFIEGEKDEIRKGSGKVIVQMKRLDFGYSNVCMNTCYTKFALCSLNCPLSSFAAYEAYNSMCDVGRVICEGGCSATGLFGNWGYLP
jgi:hypothetical protein